MTRIFDPADFQISPGAVHACAGGETPFLLRHRTAYDAYARDKSAGYPGRGAMERLIGDLRGAIAGAWQVEAGGIGFASSVAEAMSLLVETLPLGPGDNLVFEENEYPSVVLPALTLARHRGFEVRLAASADALAALVDARTRLIGVSRVSYLNGAKTELAPLRAVADRAGAVLAVDFTQAAGYMPVDAGLCDFAFSATYKWLLGCTGTAICFWNRTRQPDWSPATAGWYSVAHGAADGRPRYQDGVSLRRDGMLFSRGNPAHLPLYILASAIDYLAAYDMTALDAHVHTLTTGMIGILSGLGLPVITPADPARHGASVAFDTLRSQQLAQALAGLGVHAWGGRGRLRFSFHGYNDADDLDRIEQALRQVLATGP